MRNGFKNIISSSWLRSILFLAIIYFSQVYPFYHLHHFHDEGLLEFEISSHPIEVEVDHSSDHQHDEDTPHTNDHQHKFDKHIDWHLIRFQNQKTLTFDDQYLYSIISHVLTDTDNFKSTTNVKIIYIDDNYSSTSIIRGPPSHS